MKKKKNDLTVIIFVVIFALVGLFFGFDAPYQPDLPSDKAEYKEKDFVNEYCKGQIEYMLPDKTRIDCLVGEYAIEFDWAKKWAESIGQSLYYAKQTNLKPAVAIIMKTPSDEKYVKRIEKASPEIKIFRIKVYENSIEPAL